MEAPSTNAVPTRTAPSEAGSATPPDTLAKYRPLFDSAVLPKNAELSHWFGGLQACGYFSQMPERELLEFTRELANGVDRDMQCAGVKRGDLKPWGPRMLHLAKIIEERSLLRGGQEEVQALVARAHAFQEDFEKSQEYIVSRMAIEQLGRSTVVGSQDEFDKSHFHRVLTSLVLSLEHYCGCSRSLLCLFNYSYPRWKETKIGGDKFLVDKKLDDMVLRCTVNICNPTFITDSDKGSFHPTEQHRLEEIYDFFLAALNGSGQYRKATDFLTALHSVGKSCSVSLVADTIRGLLSDCASSPGNFRFIERIAVLSQRPPSGIPASVAKMREASEDSQSAPPCDQPPKKRSRLGK